MLTRAHRQEALSRAYIQAVAGCCGLSCGFRDFDYGIDTTLHAIRRIGTTYDETGHKLDIQAKSTTVAAAVPDEIVYDLEVDAHDRLRRLKPGTPRILVLLVLPNDEKDWISQSEDQLSLRGAPTGCRLKGCRGRRTRGRSGSASHARTCSRWPGCPP